MLYNLCVTGPNVLGGAQRLNVNATSLETLEESLQASLIFYPPEANKIVAVCILDEQFSEYILLQDFSLLPHTCKIAVQTDVADMRHDLQASATAYVVKLLAANPQPVDVDGAAVVAMIDDAVANGDTNWAGNTAFNTLRGLLVAAAATNNGAAMNPLSPSKIQQQAGTGSSSAHGTPSSSSALPAAASAAPSGGASGFGGGFGAAGMEDATPTIAGGRKSAPPSRSRKAAPPQAGAASPAAAVRQSAYGVTTTSEAAQPSALKSSTTRTATAPPSPAGAPSSPNDNTITIYCVYSGNNSQRAKAVRVDRHKPYLEGILGTLRQKFKASVVLGYIYEDGSCCEVLSDKDLATVIGYHPKAEAVTLHCWAAAGAQVQEYPASGPAGSVGATMLQNSSVMSGAPSVVSGRSAKSARSARSTQSKVSTRAGDVSSGKMTDQEMRELFDELDLDGSGYLDKMELKRFYLDNFDDMGITNADKQFEKFLESCGCFGDGKITYDEFSIVLLKIAAL